MLNYVIFEAKKKQGGNAPKGASQAKQCPASAHSHIQSAERRISSQVKVVGRHLALPLDPIARVSRVKDK
jgi:hypothetical protein